METDTNTGKIRESDRNDDTCQQRKQPWLPGTTLPFLPASPEHQPQLDTQGGLVQSQLLWRAGRLRGPCYHPPGRSHLRPR